MRIWIAFRSSLKLISRRNTVKMPPAFPDFPHHISEFHDMPHVACAARQKCLRALSHKYVAVIFIQSELLLD
jgi:hypothetical protein